MPTWKQTNQLEYSGTEIGTGNRIEAFEAQPSRSVGGETAELYFVLEGTSNETQARKHAEAALVAWDALSFDGKPLIGVALKPAGMESEDNAGDWGRWEVRAAYSRRGFTAAALLSDADQAKLQAMEFDISGERRHITQSLITLSKSVPAGKTQLDFGGAIRVKKVGKNVTVEGTDIVVPKEAFSLAKTVPTAKLTPAVRQQLRELVGTINQANFVITLNGQATTYTSGDLRFMGCNGRIVEGASRTDMTFRFEAGVTRKNLKIAEGTPSQIVVPYMAGHDLLWVAYEEQDAGSQLTLRPRQANVERVCLAGDFSVLKNLGIT